MKLRKKSEGRMEVWRPDHATLDHVLALSLGGSNDRANIVAACHECNQKRAVKEREMHRTARDEYHGFKSH
jgi:5-methylcytosine-specific restriction endonuclease McrA